MGKKRIFFKNLDAWRFVAFFVVFLGHALNTIQPSILNNVFYLELKNLTSYGYLGVNLFFVLSGFLITYLLLSEEDSFKRYSIVNFWGRRILRIWPLYIMIIIYSFVIYEPLIKLLTSVARVENAKLFYYLFFIPNFQLVIEKVHPLNNCLTVLWSVGIEEQFYLFWPLLFFIKRLRMWIILLIILGSIVFRYLNFDEVMTIKYHSFSVMGVLGIGCLLALLTFKNDIRQNSINLNKWLNAFVYVAGVLIIYFYPIYFKAPIGVALSTTFSGLFFAYLIFEQVFVKDPLFNMGRLKFLTKWGKYTYGLYCIHPIGILIAYNVTKKIHQELNFFWVIVGETVLALIISMAMAWFSYEMIEKHFLKLKSKISMITKK